MKRSKRDKCMNVINWADDHVVVGELWRDNVEKIMLYDVNRKGEFDMWQ